MDKVSDLGAAYRLFDMGVNIIEDLGIIPARGEAGLFFLRREILVLTDEGDSVSGAWGWL